MHKKNSFTGIYIPLWFYSNFEQSMANTSGIAFTFHFGFILTAQKYTHLADKQHLHSTLVLF